MLLPAPLGPITATSANRHGNPGPVEAWQAEARKLAEIIEGADVFLGLSAGGVLKPEMVVKAVLRGRKGTAMAVPEGAVLVTGERAMVWVEVSPNTFEPRMVRTGHKSSGYYEIIEGLKGDETVVTSAGFLIDSESQLKSGSSDPHAGHGGAGSAPSPAPGTPSANWLAIGDRQHAVSCCGQIVCQANQPRLVDAVAMDTRDEHNRSREPAGWPIKAGRHAPRPRGDADERLTCNDGGSPRRD